MFFLIIKLKRKPYRAGRQAGNSVKFRYLIELPAFLPALYYKILPIRTMVNAKITNKTCFKYNIIAIIFLRETMYKKYNLNLISKFKKEFLLLQNIESSQNIAKS